MRTKKALNNFKKLSDEMLLGTSIAILEAMDGNPHYPTPEPDLTDVTAAKDDFSTKLAAARRKGSPQETALKNESRVVLEDLLRRLAFYVNIAAGGVVSTLLSSGFPTSNPANSPAPPDTPGGLLLRDGRQRGQMRFRFNSVPRALGYEYQYTAEIGEDGQPVWGERYHTTSSMDNTLIVESKREYFVRVRALNAHGHSDWSYVLDSVAK